MSLLRRTTMREALEGSEENSSLEANSSSSTDEDDQSSSEVSWEGESSSSQEKSTEGSATHRKFEAFTDQQTTDEVTRGGEYSEAEQLISNSFSGFGGKLSHGRIISSSRSRESKRPPRSFSYPASLQANIQEAAVDDFHETPVSDNDDTDEYHGSNHSGSTGKLSATDEQYDDEVRKDFTRVTAEPFPLDNDVEQQLPLLGTSIEREDDDTSYGSNSATPEELISRAVQHISQDARVYVKDAPDPIASFKDSKEDEDIKGDLYQGKYQARAEGLTYQTKLREDTMDPQVSQAVLDVVKNADEDEDDNYMGLPPPPPPPFMTHNLTHAEVVSIQDEQTDEEEITMDLIVQARREIEALQAFLESQGQAAREDRSDMRDPLNAGDGGASDSSNTRGGAKAPQPIKSKPSAVAEPQSEDTSNRFLLLCVLLMLVLIAGGVVVAGLYAANVLPRHDSGGDGNDGNGGSNNSTNKVPLAPTSIPETMSPSAVPTTMAPTYDPTPPCANSTWTQLGDSIVGTTSGELLGTAVALSANGLRVAVSAPRSINTTFPNSGLLQVYQYVDGIWNPVGQPIEGAVSNYQVGSTVNSIAMSDDGTVLAVGAPSASTTAYRSGQVRVYKLLNGAWIQAGYPINGTVGASGQFGYVLSLSGDGSTIAVSSTDNANGTGLVQTFRYAGGLAWNRVGENIVGLEEGDGLGSAVVLNYNGSMMAVGAPVGGGKKGVVYVYNIVNNVWKLLGQPIVGVEQNGRFGAAVDVSQDGNTLAVGIPRSNALGANSGVLILFQWNGESWEPIGGASAGAQANDRVGSTVSISADGSRVVTGGYGTIALSLIWNDAIGNWANLGQSIEPEIPSEISGYSASLYAVRLSKDGTTVVVGDRRFNSTGSARVFQLTGCNPSLS